MGIDVVHDLPTVGANLHDHFNSYVAWRSTKTGTFNELHRSPLRQLAAGVRYVLGRDGPLTAIGTIAGILTRTDPRFDRPDLQINTYLWSIETRDHTGMHPHKFPGFSMSPVHLRPEGRGRVSLKSPDPLSPPKIEFKFLETAHDIDAMLYGVRLARKIAEQPALKPYVAEEVVPGPAVQSEDQLIEDIRNRGVSNLHPVGTCRMGTGSDAVVDPRLRVRGIKGLRVADASIMPQVVGGHEIRLGRARAEHDDRLRRGGDLFRVERDLQMGRVGHEGDRCLARLEPGLRIGELGRGGGDPLVELPVLCAEADGCEREHGRGGETAPAGDSRRGLPALRQRVAREGERPGALCAVTGDALVAHHGRHLGGVMIAGERLVVRQRRHEAAQRIGHRHGHRPPGHERRDGIAQEMPGRRGLLVLVVRLIVDGALEHDTPALRVDERGHARAVDTELVEEPLVGVVKDREIDGEFLRPRADLIACLASAVVDQEADPLRGKTRAQRRDLRQVDGHDRAAGALGIEDEALVGLEVEERMMGARRVEQRDVGDATAGQPRGHLGRRRGL